MGCPQTPLREGFAPPGSFIYLHTGGVANTHIYYWPVLLKYFSGTGLEDKKASTATDWYVGWAKVLLKPPDEKVMPTSAPGAGVGFGPLNVVAPVDTT